VVNLSAFVLSYLKYGLSIVMIQERNISYYENAMVGDNNTV